MSAKQIDAFRVKADEGGAELGRALAMCGMLLPAGGSLIVTRHFEELPSMVFVASVTPDGQAQQALLRIVATPHEDEVAFTVEWLSEMALYARDGFLNGLVARNVEVKTNVPPAFATACPFCDGSFGPLPDGRGGHNGLAHTEPACAKFNEFDPLAFVIAVNNANGVQRN